LREKYYDYFKKLTAERFEEIKNYLISYDEDSPN